MSNYVRKLLTDAVAEGFTLSCRYPGEPDPDYTGTDIKEAEKALSACDVMVLNMLKDGRSMASATIITELDPEEQIADYTITPWMEKWWEANVRV